MNSIRPSPFDEPPSQKKPSKPWPRWVKVVLIVVLALLGLAIVAKLAGAQTTEGRPDPTGQGRYMQFGTERAYDGAQVLKQLPEGAECAPAGELVGSEVWNSTREGHAILSVLTDKAEVAVTPDGRRFLCKCVKGHNELFLAEKSVSTSAPAPTPTQASATTVVPVTSATIVITPEMMAEFMGRTTPVAQIAAPCTAINVLELTTQLQKKSKKKDFSITCPPDGGMQVKWEEQSNNSGGCGSGFWGWLDCPVAVPVYGIQSYPYRQWGGRGVTPYDATREEWQRRQPPPQRRQAQPQSRGGQATTRSDSASRGGSGEVHLLGKSSQN